MDKERALRIKSIAKKSSLEIMLRQAADARERQLLWCYQFDTDRWNADAGLDGVFSALFAAFKEISGHANRRIRERTFTIWTGERGNQFLICTPAKLAAPVVNIFTRHLVGAPGYQIAEGGAYPDLPVTPTYLYENGKIVEYVDAELIEASVAEEYGVAVERRTRPPMKNLRVTRLIQHPDGPPLPLELLRLTFSGPTEAMDWVRRSRLPLGFYLAEDYDGELYEIERGAELTRMSAVK